MAVNSSGPMIGDSEAIRFLEGVPTDAIVVATAEDDR
jgi:hypothetical protein